MKKFLLLFFALIIGANFAQAQRKDVTMVPVLEKSLSIIDLIENDHDMEIVRLEFDIVKSSKDSYRTLTKNYEYTIVAFADDRVKDIDVALYKRVGNEWVQVASDNDNSDIAVMSYTPTETANYKVVVSVYAFNPGYSAAHYGLIYFHE
jgi:hypothetical protein